MLVIIWVIFVFHFLILSALFTELFLVNSNVSYIEYNNTYMETKYINSINKMEKEYKKSLSIEDYGSRLASSN